MTKRIKSWLITSVSIVGTAFLAVVVTPEWADFLHFAHDKAIGWGVPAVVVALVGVLISEVWKELINRYKISQANKLGMGMEPMDLY